MLSVDAFDQFQITLQTPSLITDDFAYEYKCLAPAFTKKWLYQYCPSIMHLMTNTMTQDEANFVSSFVSPFLKGYFLLQP